MQEVGKHACFSLLAPEKSMLRLNSFTMTIPNRVHDPVKPAVCSLLPVDQCIASGQTAWLLQRSHDDDDDAHHGGDDDLYLHPLCKPRGQDASVISVLSGLDVGSDENMI